MIPWCSENMRFATQRRALAITQSHVLSGHIIKIEGFEHQAKGWAVEDVTGSAFH